MEEAMEQPRRLGLGGNPTTQARRHRIEVGREEEGCVFFFSFCVRGCEGQYNAYSGPHGTVTNRQMA